MRRECQERFPRHWIQMKPLVSHSGMHHSTYVTRVPWCMSGSLTRGDEENVSGIPCVCAAHNFTCLTRGTWWPKNSAVSLQHIKWLPNPYIHRYSISHPLGQTFLILPQPLQCGMQYHVLEYRDIMVLTLCQIIQSSLRLLMASMDIAYEDTLHENDDEFWVSYTHGNRHRNTLICWAICWHILGS